MQAPNQIAQTGPRAWMAPDDTDLRKITGGLDIRWFGAVCDGVSDMQPAWTMADVYAAATGGAVHIPSPPIGSPLQWTLKTPMTITAAHTYGDARATSPHAGTAINWRPNKVIEGAAAVTTVNPCALGNVSLFCDEHDGVTPGTLIAKGWIKTAAALTASFNGTTMTVQSVQSGAVAIGQSISGQGMAPASMGGCVILSGSGNTWTVSVPQPTISGVAVTATLLPKFRALKDGSTLLRVLEEFRGYGLSVTGGKIGVDLAAPSGHITIYDSYIGGVIGTYTSANGFDHRFINCLQDGVLAAKACGTNGFGSHNGYGHVGFAAFAMLQLDDEKGGNFFGAPEFNSCSFEFCGEAVIQTLAGNYNTGFVMHGLPGCSFDASMQLPTSLVPIPHTYTFQLLGTLVGFVCDSVSLYAYPNGSVWQSGCLGVANIGSIASNTNSDMDLDVFGSAWKIQSVANNAADYDVRASQIRSDRRFQRKSEKTMLGLMTPQGNLLQNPEIAGNWSIAGGKASVAVSALQTLLAGPLAGVNVSREMYEELGNNPTVTVFSPNAGGFLSVLRAALVQVTNPCRALTFRAWILSSGANPTLTVTCLLPNGREMDVSHATGNMSATAFAAVQSIGTTMADYGCTSIERVLLDNGGSTQPLYIAGVMLCHDDFAPYSANPGPTAILPIGYQKVPTVAQLNNQYPASMFSPYTPWAAIDGRNTGEAAGAGSGCPVFVKNGAWCAVWSGVAVTS